MTGYSLRLVVLLTLVGISLAHSDETSDYILKAPKREVHHTKECTHLVTLKIVGCFHEAGSPEVNGNSGCPLKSGPIHNDYKADKIIEPRFDYPHISLVNKGAKLCDEAYKEWKSKDKGLPHIAQLGGSGNGWKPDFSGSKLLSRKDGSGEKVPYRVELKEGLGAVDKVVKAVTGKPFNLKANGITASSGVHISIPDRWHKDYEKKLEKLNWYLYDTEDKSLISLLHA